MIVPLAFTWVHKTDPDAFELNDVKLTDVIHKSTYSRYEAYVAFVETETMQGGAIKLQCVVDVDVVDYYECVGKVTTFEGSEQKLQEIGARHGNLAYLRALRDKLNEMDIGPEQYRVVTRHRPNRDDAFEHEQSLINIEEARLWARMERAEYGKAVEVRIERRIVGAWTTIKED